MRFTKVHGLGNDFIFLDSLPQGDLAQWSRLLCDRHFGIGADGLLLTLPSETADLRMRIFNPDGSEPEMCGNALRCLAKLAYERGGLPETFTIETLAGIQKVEMVLQGPRVQAVRVRLPEPILDPEEIPVAVPGERVINQPLKVFGLPPLFFTGVSIGNPHAVIFVEDAESIPLDKWGPLIEEHPLFPAKVNVEFVQVFSPDRLRMRVWERGAGVTLACGTGACASLVAGVLTGRSANQAQILLDGGVLEISYQDGELTMTGPATTVFSGQWLGGEQ